MSTSALLVGSALAILLTVGAVLSFHGFPGPSAEQSTDGFVIDGLLTGDLGAGGGRGPELVLDPLRRESAAGRADADGDARSPLAAGAAGSEPTDAVVGEASPAGTSGTPITPLAPPSGPRSSSGGGGSGGSGDPVGEVRETLGRAVQPLLPDGPGDLLGQSPGSLTEGLDGATGALGR